jgi:hypothetical protein
MEASHRSEPKAKQALRPSVEESARRAALNHAARRDPRSVAGAIGYWLARGA